MFKRIVCLVVMLSLPIVLHAQHVGQKTNMLYWATGTPNASVEVALGRKVTIDLAAGYNPWDYTGSASMRHWVVRTGPRYWFCRSFQGHFIGVDALYGKYNIGNLPYPASMQDFSYKGSVYGGSISYGYHFPVGRRWGLELTAGFGYLKTRYDKYSCDECVEVFGSYERTYLGPTKLGVSFVFMF